MRYLRIIIAVILILLVTTLPVFAEQDIQSKADALNMVSVLKGAGTGYNLDDQLKRSEASTFIVRLLGQENNVIENSEMYSMTNFPDVRSTDWFAPYVGYCAEQGILAGYLDGTFQPNDYISEKSFLKMVLCALGYIYGDDFTWSNVNQMAYDTGIVTDYDYSTKVDDNTHYIRENVVEVLYNALTLENKMTQQKQIHSIIAEGAVTKEIATQAGFIKDDILTTVVLVTPMDKDKLSIMLNENIKPITAENISIYESIDQMKKLDITVETQASGQIVLNTSNQSPDKAYIVELLSITDTDGNATDRLFATFNGFRSPELRSDFFRISKAEVVSRNTVDLYFTQPINLNSEIASNYSIYQNGSVIAIGSTQTMSVKLVTSVNNAVRITFKDMVFDSGAEYELKVAGSLSSAYGVNLNEKLGDSIRFKGLDAVNEKFELINIAAVNNKTLQIDFNMEINPTIAQQIFSYYITDSNGNPISISKAVVSSNADTLGRSVFLTISTSFDRLKNYSIMINQMYDVTRQSSILEKSYTFSGYYPDKTPFTLVNVTAIDAGTLAVYFDRPLDSASAALVNNYRIYDISQNGFSVNPVKTYYDTAIDPYLVKLFLPADKLLADSRTYKLTVMPSLQDYMGNFSTNVLELVFAGSWPSTAKPVMMEAVIISSDAIRVTFNKEIALDVPNLLNTNYILKNEDNGAVISRIPSTVTLFNATTMILRFDSLVFDEKYTLEFDALKDYSGENVRKKADGSNSIDVILGSEH